MIAKNNEQLIAKEQGTIDC